MASGTCVPGDLRCQRYSGTGPRPGSEVGRYVRCRVGRARLIRKQGGKRRVFLPLDRGRVHANEEDGVDKVVRVSLGKKKPAGRVCRDLADGLSLWIRIPLGLGRGYWIPEEGTSLKVIMSPSEIASGKMYLGTILRTPPRVWKRYESSGAQVYARECTSTGCWRELTAERLRRIC